MLFFVVALLALALDQLTKYLILRNLLEHQAISLGILDIRHVHNAGAAFGMLQNANYLFVGIALVVLVALLASFNRIRQAPMVVVIALGLIAGGTIGNLIDRLRFRHVVDFIDFRWWPVFNVADSCICIGVGLLVWKIFHSQEPKEPPPSQISEPQSLPAPPV